MNQYKYVAPRGFDGLFGKASNFFSSITASIYDGSVWELIYRMMGMWITLFGWPTYFDEFEKQTIATVDQLQKQFKNVHTHIKNPQKNYEAILDIIRKCMKELKSRINENQLLLKDKCANSEQIQVLLESQNEKMKLLLKLEKSFQELNDSLLLNNSFGEIVDAIPNFHRNEKEFLDAIESLIEAEAESQLDTHLLDQIVGFITKPNIANRLLSNDDGDIAIFPTRETDRLLVSQC